MINRIVAWILRSSAHGLLDRSVVLLRLHGRVSKRLFEFPVQYARSTDGLVILPGHPERKQWWRNLRAPTATEVFIGARWRPAVSRVADAGDAQYSESLAAYRRRWPRIHVPEGDPVVLVALVDSASLPG